MIARQAVVLGVIALTSIAIACGGGAQPTPQFTQIAVAPSTDAAAPEIAPASDDGGASASAPPKMSDADKVVAARRAGFRRCYSAGLRVDPTMSGRVVMRIAVDPSGEIASAETVQREGLSPEVAECILNEMKTARFAAPGGNGSTLMIPVKFVQQNNDAGTPAAP